MQTPGFIKVASSTELAEGEMKCVDAHGREVVLARVKGEIFAFDAVCSHQLAYLEEGELRDYTVVCPLHNGAFDIRTGAATARPATQPIKVYACRLEGDDVLVQPDPGA